MWAARVLRPVPGGSSSAGAEEAGSKFGSAHRGHARIPSNTRSAEFLSERTRSLCTLFTLFAIRFAFARGELIVWECVVLVFLIFHVVSFSSRRLYDTTDEGAAAWHRRMMIDEQKRGSDGKGAGSGKRAMDVDGVA